VNVTESSLHTIKTMAASPNTNSSIRYKIDGEDITGSVIIPNTGGWQSYRTILTKGINLDAGTHILQLFEETGGFNIDKIIFEKEEIIASVSPTLQRAPHRIYPNPASTELTIECSEQDPFVFKSAIFDMSGQAIEIFDHEPNGNRISLDVSSVHPGCYVLKIYSPKAVQTRKLLIQRD
jgi:arabinoxylan arabinofuranohydrolase